MHGMQLLAAWVHHVGGGLVLTGGKIPMATAATISRQLSRYCRFHLSFAVSTANWPALMVVLDRSGSMAAPARGDRTKMDLANIAAASSLDLLSPFDEFGLLAVDTQAHEVVPLQRMTEKQNGATVFCGSSLRGRDLCFRGHQ